MLLLLLLLLLLLSGEQKTSLLTLIPIVRRFVLVDAQC
jgi:hypothetical protein